MYAQGQTNNVQTIAIQFSGLASFNDYYQLPSKDTVNNYSLSTSNLISYLNAGDILGNEAWTASNLKDSSIYALGQTNNYYTPTNNLYTYNTTVQNCIAIEFAKNSLVSYNGQNNDASNENQIPGYYLKQTISARNYPSIYITGFTNSNLSTLATSDLTPTIN
ncbi:hypothetical protein J6W20_04820 [bacterium]|nr:hypothetical protein [bacterium]